MAVVLGRIHRPNVHHAVTDAIAPGHTAAMTPLARSVPLVLTLLAAACAPEPMPALEPTPPATITPPTTTPPTSPVSLDTRPVAPFAPGVLARSALAGPQLVSGSAWRNDRGELHASVMFEGSSVPAAALHATLRADDGTPLEVLDPVAVDPPAPNARGLVQVRLPPSELRARAASMEVVMTDVRGGESIVFTLSFTAFRGVRDGERCLPDYGLNECDLGSICGPARVCGPPVAPTLTRAEAFRSNDGTHSAVRLAWTDPNGDVEAVEVTAGVRTIPRLYPLPPRATAPVTDGELRWPDDAFQGQARVWIRLRDHTGAFSEAREVQVTPPPTLGDGALCDLEGVTSRCGDGSVCTRFGLSSCYDARCRDDVRTCPAGIEVTHFDSAPSPEGTWSYTETRPRGGSMLPSSCDRDLGAERVYRFHVPAAGTWRFELRSEGAEYGRLAVRTRCVMGDVEAGQSDGTAATLPPVELTLREPQDVYLFPFISRPSGRPFTVTVSRLP